MDQLPDDILLIIFNFLDNKSMLSAMRVSKRWTQIFATSPKLLSKFTLIVNEKTSKIFKNLPFVPVRNIKIQNYTSTTDDFKKAAKGIKIFKNSVRNLEFKKVMFRSNATVRGIINSLKFIESVMFRDCFVKPSCSRILKQLPFLTSVSFYNSNDEFFKIFHAQKVLSKVAVHRRPMSADLNFSFHELCLTLPNLQEIKTLGYDTAHYYDMIVTAPKIRKLTACMISTYSTEYVPRLSYLGGLRGYLKELTLENLPMDFDGDRFLRFIIEEMNLETFYYDKIPLILNGQKQEVEEFTARASEVQSLYEMFRQFPSISRFTIVIGVSGAAANDFGFIINPPTRLFENVKKLRIADYSKEHRYMKNFNPFFRHFRNIEKLSIISHDEMLSTVISEFLPEMTRVKEIFLGSKVKNVGECLKVVKRSTHNLRKLTVADVFVKEAKSAFGEEIKIAKIHNKFFASKERHMKFHCSYDTNMKF